MTIIDLRLTGGKTSALGSNLYVLALTIVTGDDSISRRCLVNDRPSFEREGQFAFRRRLKARRVYVIGSMPSQYQT